MPYAALVTDILSGQPGPWELICDDILDVEALMWGDHGPNVQDPGLLVIGMDPARDDPAMSYWLTFDDYLSNTLRRRRFYAIDSVS